MSFGRWLGSQFREHRLARRIIVAWAMTMGTIVILRTTDDMSLVTASVASLVTTVLGLLTVPIGFYFRHRKEDDSK